MKLAVLSDIHSNSAALQVVAQHIEDWQPDHIIVAGDLVNRGPRPLECLRLVQSKGWPMLLGNHEEYVLKHDAPNEPRSGPLFEVRRSSYWTYQALGGDMAPLRAMPFRLDLRDPDGGDICLTHASLRGTRDGVYVHTPDAELRAQMGMPDSAPTPAPTLPGSPSPQPPRSPAVFCVGHTHMPLIRQLDQTLVVNAGSAGLPFDGDPRASYAQITWQKNRWKARIVRLEYDRARAAQDFVDSGFLDNGGPLAQLMLIELHSAHSQLYQWTVRYEKAVLAGQISLADSVQQFKALNGLVRFDLLGWQVFRSLPPRVQRYIAGRRRSQP
jgi:predicted phosphodiesterase